MPNTGDVADNIDKYFFSLSYYCYMLKCMSEISSILDMSEESEDYLRRYETAKEEFIKRYFIPDEAYFTPRLQTGIILPLVFGLYPAEYEQALGDKLNEYVLKDGRLNTGFVGTRYLLQVLTKYGHLDTAFALLDGKEWPSWRYMLSTGATTITEVWDGHNAYLNGSKNHFTFGSVVGWMFECLGGIDFENSEPGFKSVVLRPNFVKEIGDFETTFNSASGKIKTAWRYEANRVKFTFETEMPAKVILPDGNEHSFEKGKNTLYFNI